MENTLKLTLVSGREITLVAEYSEAMEEEISDSDGYKITLSPRPVKRGSLKAYIDGKLVDSCSSPESWQLVDIINEVAQASGCTKAIYGIKVALTEQNANLYKEWIDKVIEDGTTAEAREYRAEKARKEIEYEKTSALNYIARAEKYMESGQKLMTAEEYRKWARNYNNVANEGGDGYVPELPTKEGYEAAKKYIESL